MRHFQFCAGVLVALQESEKQPSEEPPLAEPKPVGSPPAASEASDSLVALDPSPAFLLLLVSYYCKICYHFSNVEHETEQYVTFVVHSKIFSEETMEIPKNLVF